MYFLLLREVFGSWMDVALAYSRKLRGREDCASMAQLEYVPSFVCNPTYFTIANCELFSALEMHRRIDLLFLLDLFELSSI